MPTAPHPCKPAPRSIAAYYAGHAPALKRLRGAALLRELAARWRSHAMVSRNLQPLFKQPEARFTQPAITGVGTVAPPAAAVAASAAGAGAARESLEASRHRAFEKDCFRPSRAEFTAALAEVVNDAREGRAAIDRGVLRTAVDVFVQMGHVPGSAASLAVYKEGFEPMLLEITASFYRVRSGLWLDADTVSAYLRRADAALKEESALCAECFHESTGAPLKLAVERELLERPFEAIVEKEGSGVKAMLRQERLEDLRLVYDLYHRSAVPACLGRLARVFEGHIVALGEGLIRDRAAPAAAAVGATGAGVGAGEAGAAAAAAAAAGGKNAEKKAADERGTAFVRGLLELHDKSSLVVRDCFANDADFHRAMKMAFQTLVNRDVAGEPEFRTVELLAGYTNGVMIDSARSDVERDAECKRIVGVFEFIASKDVFEAFYCKALKARLLTRDSTNNLATERAMVAHFQTSCGMGYIRKMKGMLDDYETSTTTLAVAYKEATRAHFAAQGAADAKAAATAALGGVDFKPLVLTASWWPGFDALGAISFSPRMQVCMEHFARYYDSANPGRHLAWQPLGGSISAVATFANGGKYDVVLSTMQAIMLDYFSERAAEPGAAPLSFTDLRAAVCPGVASGAGGGDAAERATKAARVVLHSLACGKYKILLKSPMDATIKDADTFVVNPNFSDKMKKFSVPMAEVTVAKKVPGGGGGGSGGGGGGIGAAQDRGGEPGRSADRPQVITSLKEEAAASGKTVPDVFKERALVMAAWKAEREARRRAAAGLRGWVWQGGELSAARRAVRRLRPAGCWGASGGLRGLASRRGVARRRGGERTPPRDESGGGFRPASLPGVAGGHKVLQTFCCKLVLPRRGGRTTDRLRRQISAPPHPLLRCLHHKRQQAAAHQDRRSERRRAPPSRQEPSPPVCCHAGRRRHHGDEESW